MRRFRKWIGTWVAVSLLLVTGCGRGAADLANGSQTASKVHSDAEAASEMEILEEVKNAGIDNTLDKYTAITKHSLRIAADDKANGEVSVSLNENVICLSQGVHLGKHLYESPGKDWDEICFAGDSGEEVRKRLEYPDGGKMYSWGIGSVWGSDDVLLFVTEMADDGGRKLLFLETDDSLQVRGETEAACFVNEKDRYEKPRRCKKDADGLIHVVTAMMVTDPDAEPSPWRYCVMDENGSRLFEWQDEGFSSPELRFDADGNVLLQTYTFHVGRLEPTDRHVLCRWDKDEGKMKTLTEIPVTEENWDWSYSVPTEGVLLTANPKGIYRTRDGAEEELYIWGRHGISVSHVYDLQQTPDGRIQVIYDSDGVSWYVSLREVTERREITELEFAVSTAMKQTYQIAADEFNKRFPTYHVSVKDDYDEKQLLTKLTAGDGPVLIDSSLTGFEGQEKLWMPLDNLFVQLGLDGVLIEGAMRLGELDGRLYGVVSNFWIQTVVTKAKKSGHWDYEEFLDYVREKPVDAVLNYNAGSKGLTLFTDLFNHGLEDNYYLDADLGGESFEGREFGELLDLAEKYFGSDGLRPEDERLWPEGGALCHYVTINRPEDLEAFRLFYGEDVFFAGYPSGEGEGHYLCSVAPLTVRKTASVKEKAAALAFIRYLLSEEVQKEAAGRDLNFFLSVRKDVLDFQIRGMEGGTTVFKHGYPNIKIKEKPDYETVEKVLYELLEHSAPRRTFPKELRDIIIGELEEYFDGGITRDALMDHLKKRVGLYLSENMK